MLLSVAAFSDSPNSVIIKHCRAVAEVIPVIGFYLQPAVGGIKLDVNFWREFAQIENVIAIKLAPLLAVLVALGIRLQAAVNLRGGLAGCGAGVFFWDGRWGRELGSKP